MNYFQNWNVAIHETEFWLYKWHFRNMTRKRGRCTILALWVLSSFARPYALFDETNWSVLMLLHSFPLHENVDLLMKQFYTGDVLLFAESPKLWKCIQCTQSCNILCLRFKMHVIILLALLLLECSVFFLLVIPFYIYNFVQEDCRRELIGHKGTDIHILAELFGSI